MDYLVIDVEATCFEVKQGTEEIIEIGAVLANEKGEVVKEFQSFVKPVRNPVLSDFCKKLTSINQADVDGAPPFDEAMHGLLNWLDGTGDVMFCSWGDYDRKQFLRDCEFKNVGFPFNKHYNLKEAFNRHRSHERMGVGRALSYLGLSFKGTPHRGIDDAKNIARLLKEILPEVEKDIQTGQYWKL